MRSMMKRVGVLVVGLVSLSLTCEAKKLWGVDVGKKEEKGEFESLLQRAGQDGKAGGALNDRTQGWASLAELDFSRLSLSEICTYALDVVIATVQDEEWLAEFAEPGAIRELMDKSGMGGVMAEDGMASDEKDEVKELLALEGNPILYKTKYYELAEKTIGKLISLRMDVSNPKKLRALIRDTLKSAGFERDLINQVMDIVDHPEMLSAQINALLNDPAVAEEIAKLSEMFTTAAGVMEDGEVNEEEIMQLMKGLEGLEADPEVLEELYKEMMKDPALAEALLASGGDFGGGGGEGAFNGLGGRPEGARVREL